MDKDKIINWTKKYIEEGNKLVQNKFNSSSKNNIPVSLRQVRKNFGSWANFYKICVGQDFCKPQKSIEVNCENCNKLFKRQICQIKKCKNNFCSRSCNATFTNSNRGPMKEESKQKLREYYKNNPRKTINNPKKTNNHVIFLDSKKCYECGTIFEYNIHSSTGKYREINYCSNKCIGKVGGRIGGKISAALNVRRSKNEIYFADLCIELLGEKEVLTNEPMFDGWDADVIIPKYKLAILWNGIWHYQKVRHKHSLEQVQSRDRIKAKIIEKYDYELYIIKDMGRYNKKFVTEQFNIFKNIYFPNLN